MDIMLLGLGFILGAASVVMVTLLIHSGRIDDEDDPESVIFDDEVRK